MINEKRFPVREESFEQALTKACDGLLYMSESEAEIVPFFGTKTVAGVRQTIFKQLELTNRAPIEEGPSAEFFACLTKVNEWFSKAETQNARRFEKLQTLLEENLDDLTVLRIGRIQIDIYVAGIDKSGNLAGIKTKAIET